MSITNIAMRAYSTALETERKDVAKKVSDMSGTGKAKETGFGGMLTNSLKTVNDLDSQKNSMISSFASGETENVHDLMISLQKAGLAMSMTSAVRNKVMDAYNQLMRTTF